MNQEQLKILKEQNPFAALHDLISDLIMQDIISFRIAPGTRLVENALAEGFGVSRSPVRAALESCTARDISIRPTAISMSRSSPPRSTAI